MSVLTFNNFDFNFMLGRVSGVDHRKKGMHKSTFWKQMSHTLIIFGVNLGYGINALRLCGNQKMFRLTIATLVAMNNEMKLIDVNGKAHSLTKYDVGWMLGAGWILHLAALALNYIYYKIHPSSPDISSEAVWEKIKDCNCVHLKRIFKLILWKIRRFCGSSNMNEIHGLEEEEEGNDN